MTLTYKQARPYYVLHPNHFVDFCNGFFHSYWCSRPHRCVALILAKKNCTNQNLLPGLLILYWILYCVTFFYLKIAIPAQIFHILLIKEGWKREIYYNLDCPGGMFDFWFRKFFKMGWKIHHTNVVSDGRTKKIFQF